MHHIETNCEHIMSYKIYHSTYTSALDTVIQEIAKKGFTVSDDDWFALVNMGPRKPRVGETVSLNLPLTKIDTNIQTKKYVHIQVFNRDYDIVNNFELNFYRN